IPDGISPPLRRSLLYLDPQRRRSMRASATSGLLLLTALGAATAAMADGKAYVGNFKDDTVSVIDVRTATVTATVPVAAGPHGMAASPAGATGVVTGDN